MIKRNKKRIISIILIVIIIGLIVFICYYYINQYNNSKKRKILLNKTIEAINNNTVKNDNKEEISDSSNEEIVIPDEKELKKNKDSIDNYTTIGILEIPSLKIKYPIISETSNKALKISVTKYWGSNPNQVGNMVIVGHNYRSSYMLSKLPNININDDIIITDNMGKSLVYKVYETKKIDPNDNDCTSQLTDGKIEVTIITCLDRGKSRFYAKARAVE